MSHTHQVIQYRTRYGRSGRRALPGWALPSALVAAAVASCAGIMMVIG